MIRDAQVLADIRQQWNAVRKLAAGERSYFVGGMQINETWPNEAFNLPFVLAYAVLDQVLSAFVKQGVFACNTWMLGPKMNASQSVLPWQNYAVVDKGKEARNAVAHKGKPATKGECLKYIAAVEVELTAWGVL